MLNVVQAIILAAGKSRRFKTDRTKLIEPICGQPMILYQTKLLDHLGILTTLVVGYQKELVQESVIKEHENSISFIQQFEQKGTGDALKCTRHLWIRDHILIMNGDVPLVTETIIDELYTHHIDSGAPITFVISHDTYQVSEYGRVLKSGLTVRIIEAKNDDRKIQDEMCCINAGIYLFRKDFLIDFIDKIMPNELTGEYYITDLINIASDNNLLVQTVNVPFDRVRGVNTQEELWTAEQIKRAEIIKAWMLEGVRFMAPHNVYIDHSVIIGKGAVIGVGVHLLGKTEIGEYTTVGSFSIIINSIIGNKAIIKSHSVIEDSVFHQESLVGPFAYCHRDTILGSKSVIGAFVESKNSKLGDMTKAKHLSYLGDACIGSMVNIGGGTIIANHDGQDKHKTIINNNAYIGVNSSLVAPLTIEQDAFVAAGSTITENVPTGALAIARSRQINKPEYAYRLKNKKILKNGINSSLLFESPFKASSVSSV